MVSDHPHTRRRKEDELSDVVEAVGAGIDSDQIGREVFGMNDWFADCATADYCTSAWTSVAVKPSRLTHPEAASVRSEP